MAPQTGRTVDWYVKLMLDNSAGALTEVAIDELGDLGLTNPEMELVAFLDAVRGKLLSIPDFEVEIGGPFSTTTHTHLTGVAGSNGPVSGAPLAFDFRIGIRHTWEAGEPTFGVTGTSANGGLLANYRLTNNCTRWKAKLFMFAGSAAPEWATTAHT